MPLRIPEKRMNDLGTHSVKTYNYKADDDLKKKIVNMLRGDISKYSMDNVIKMLENPKEMVTNDEGELVIIKKLDYNVVDVADKELFIWMATPVAMAVFLKKYSSAKKLIDIGCTYEPHKRFRYITRFSDCERHVKLEDIINNYEYYIENDATDVFDCNVQVDVSNMELMTCLVNSKECIVEGVYEELMQQDTEITLLNNALGYMGEFYRQCIPMLYLNAFSDVNYNTKTQEIKCIERYVRQLKRLLELGNEKLIIDAKMELHSFLKSYIYVESFWGSIFENENDNDYIDKEVISDLFLSYLRYIRFQHLKKDKVLCIKLLLYHLDGMTELMWRALEPKERSSVKTSSFFNKTMLFSSDLYKELRDIFKDLDECNNRLFYIMFAGYIGCEDRKDMDEYRTIVARFLCELKIEIREAYESGIEAALGILPRNFIWAPEIWLPAVLEIIREASIINGTEYSKLILDTNKPGIKDFYRGMLTYICSEKYEEKLPYIRANIECVDELIYSDELWGPIECVFRLMNDVERKLLCIKLKLINKDNIDRAIDACIENKSLRIIPYLMAYMDEMNGDL